MKRILTIFLLTIGMSLLCEGKVYIVSNGDNLFQTILLQEGVSCQTVCSADEALRLAGKGDGIIVTATDYPTGRAQVPPTLYKAAKNRGIRVFVEYPSILPDGQAGDIYTADLERGVVTSPVFGLKPMSIVGINGCSIIKAECAKPMIVLGKVAGYDTAVFGIDDVTAHPVLYRSGNSLVATTSFSNCISGRYGPADSWASIMSHVLGWVLRKDSFRIDSLPFDPKPSYSKDETLPEDAGMKAAISAADWLWNANLFIHPSWEKELLRKYQPVGGDPNRYFGEPITDEMLQGDGCRGIMEGHASNIDKDGVQEYRYFVRADVHGESAMLLASAGSLTGDSLYTETAEKLLDYLFHTSDFRDGERGNKTSPVYGQISWANTHPGAFFNDDHARCVLGAIGASAMMDNQRWNSFIVENILSNLRLSSEDGFIGSSLWEHEIVKNGWQWYADRKDFVNPSAHFESWMWACYLWLYDKTGYKPLLDKAKKGISYMMKVYPDWHAQNGIQQERARMILPLAWLVRVEDTPEHREWLDVVARRFLENQDECGAIREELGDASSDKNNLLISSNAEYGKNEASLIARNGDPVSDMLYTCNFGFFALNEAYKATGKYGSEVKKLADFLVRIQVKSESHSDLDGAWFRAFDYGRWDYWASNADNGWGAWCTLCGWIETWIGVTEGLISKDTSYWEVTRNMNMTEALENSLWMMDRNN